MLFSPLAALVHRPAYFTTAANWVTIAIEAIGIAVLVGGIVFAVVRRLTRASGGGEGVYRAFRRDLGRAIVLALEFLVAADIIATVAIELTWESVGTLALVVLIRTLLSFSLEVEINGRWPWQRAENGSASG